MSTYYLVDPFDTNQPIIDVTRSDVGQIDATGAIVVRVPAGVAIHDQPSTMAELQDSKALGLLASYAGFTSIELGDCFTSNDVDSALCKSVAIGSGAVNHTIFPGGVLITTATGLTTAPAQCIVAWEAYSFSDSDDASGRFSRVYVDQASDLLECKVAFAGPAAVTTSGSVLNVSAADQGNSVVLTFTNPGTSRLFLGSWAVIY